MNRQIMNTECLLKVENVSKAFEMTNSFDRSRNTFLALKNISFEVKKGDVVSIIGNNGSGKSTLLKILSNVTKPTNGEVLIYGTSSSILDIGNNFHPDLTGRENVNLQLNLKGRSKLDIKTDIAQILAFSEIGDFFDQPIKHYSNGMFLRLAFSLAFHIGSDILILDEVLSVGDEGFRLKCQEFLKKITEAGKTIIFVSHNRMEVLELSNRCIWIEKGEIKKMGIPSQILGEYFAKHKENFDENKTSSTIEKLIQKEDAEIGIIDLSWDDLTNPSNEIMAIKSIKVKPSSSEGRIYQSDSVSFTFLIHKYKKGVGVGVFFFIQDIFYQPVLVGYSLNNCLNEDTLSKLKDEVGLIEISCGIPANFLIPGKYYLHLKFGKENGNWTQKSPEVFRFSEQLSFIVHPDDGYIDHIGDLTKGSVRPPLEWKCIIDK